MSYTDEQIQSYLINKGMDDKNRNELERIIHLYDNYPDPQLFMLAEILLKLNQLNSK